MKPIQVILSIVVPVAALGFPHEAARAQDKPAADRHDQHRQAVPTPEKEAGGKAAPTHSIPPGGIGLTRPGQPSPAVTVTDEDLEVLARKLVEFGNQLSPTEKLMMDWLLQRAASAAPDQRGGTEVQGFLFTPPVVAAGAVEGDLSAEAGQAGAPAAAPPAAAGAEETMEISPAPKAALGRALGMVLRPAEPDDTSSQAPRHEESPQAPARP
jgi:hypothetical protein